MIELKFSDSIIFKIKITLIDFIIFNGSKYFIIITDFLQKNACFDFLTLCLVSSVTNFPALYQDISGSGRPLTLQVNRT